MAKVRRAFTSSAMEPRDMGIPCEMRGLEGPAGVLTPPTDIDCAIRDFRRPAFGRGPPWLGWGQGRAQARTKACQVGT